MLQPFHPAREALRLERIAKTLDELHDSAAQHAPQCFISYAWGSAQIQARVRRLADDLKRAGIQVLFDLDHNVAGTSIERFTEYLKTVKKIVIIATPLLLTKHRNKEGVLGQHEIPKIIERVRNTVRNPADRTVNDVLPALFEGDPGSAIPEELRGEGPARLVYIDFRHDESYEAALIGLLKGLYESHINTFARDAIETAAKSLDQRKKEAEQELECATSPEILAQVVNTRRQEYDRKRAGRVIKKWQLPCESTHFVERPYVTERLEQIFSRQRRNPATVVAVLQGLAGVGKSAEALQYAHKSNYAMTIWLQSRTEFVLQEELLSLAHHLGLLPDLEESNSEKLQRIKRWFSSHNNWLLVFDSCDDPDWIDRYIPSVGGSVIVTSRNSIWPDKQVVEVKPLDKPSATKVLRQYRPDEKGETSLSNLAERLGGLPLALVQAGRYLLRTGKTPQEFLSYLNKGNPDILSQLFNLRIRGIEDVQRRMLNLSAFLYADAIPTSLLRGCIGGNDDDFNKSLQALNSAGLITGDQTVVKTHRLLQEFVARSLPMEEKREMVVKLGKVSQEIYHQKAHAHRRQLIPSLEILYRHLHPFLDEDTTITSDVTSLALLLGRYYQKEKGDSKSALPYYEVGCALNKADRKGSSRRALAKSLSLKASVLVDQLQGDEALKLYLEAVELNIKIYKQKSVQVAQEMNNLAVAFRKLGRTQEARFYIEQSLAIYEREKGVRSSEFAKCQGTLAGILRDLGEAHEALPLCKDSLRILQENTRPPNRDIATSLGHLGSTYLALGKMEEAAKFYRESLEMKEALYEHDHPEIASALGLLASAYQEDGKSEQARQLYERSMEIKRRWYEDGHPYIALSKVGLARALIDQDPEKALNYAKEAVAVFEGHYREGHEYLSRALYTQSLVLLKLGFLPHAEEACRRAIEIDNKLFPKEHPKLLEGQRRLKTIRDRMSGISKRS